MIRLKPLFILCSALFLLLATTQALPLRIENSVVKIVNQYNRFNWYAPWESGATGKGTGSGFVIEGKRIMTNAHVVSDSALLLVYFFNDPTPYPARVVAIGHDCDLAVLELEDTARIQSVPALEFDGLPELRSKVFTYGYPAGGQRISSTAGIVSRIDQQTYVHSGVDLHLTVQTDAAINPGNSGGPVIQAGKVVGVAFQGNSRLENTGFFIPTQITEHFLTDLKDGTYHGYPECGFTAANLENPAARAYSGMTAAESGIRVDTLIKNGSAEFILKEGDVLTAIDGLDVANNGTINWNGSRLDFAFLFDQRQMGETVELDIIRGAERLKLDLPLNFYNPTPSLANLYDRRPEYFIYAGLVFVPLNRETLRSNTKRWQVDAPPELLYEFFYRPLIEHDAFDAPQVMQIRRLDHSVNIEETVYLYRIIDTINGQQVRTLSEVAAALEGSTATHQEIRFKYGGHSTFIDREKAEKANAEILERYAIPQDRSL